MNLEKQREICMLSMQSQFAKIRGGWTKKCSRSYTESFFWVHSIIFSTLQTVRNTNFSHRTCDVSSNGCQSFVARERHFCQHFVFVEISKIRSNFCLAFEKSSSFPLWHICYSRVVILFFASLVDLPQFRKGDESISVHIKHIKGCFQLSLFILFGGVLEITLHHSHELFEVHRPIAI